MSQTGRLLPWGTLCKVSYWVRLEDCFLRATICRFLSGTETGGSGVACCKFLTESMEVGPCCNYCKFCINLHWNFAVIQVKSNEKSRKCFSVHRSYLGLRWVNIFGWFCGKLVSQWTYFDTDTVWPFDQEIYFSWEAAGLKSCLVVWCFQLQTDYQYLLLVYHREMFSSQNR